MKYKISRYIVQCYVSQNVDRVDILEKNPEKDEKDHM